MHHIQDDKTFEKRREIISTLAKLARMGAVAAGTLAVATQVNAADLYGGGGFKDAPMVLATTWTGFYVGAHVGGAWADMQTTDVGNALYTEGWGSYLRGDQWNNVATGRHRRRPGLATTIRPAHLCSAWKRISAALGCRINTTPYDY